MNTKKIFGAAVAAAALAAAGALAEELMPRKLRKK